MALLQQIKENRTSFLNKFSNDKRKEALQKFLEIGFPKKKTEEYKYTNLSEITKKDYNFQPKEEHHISKKELDNLHVNEENFDYIVFINGVFQDKLSRVRQQEISFEVLNEKNAQDNQTLKKYFNSIALENNSFADLNLAYHQQVLLIHIAKNVQVKNPLHIFYLSQNQEQNSFYNPRNLLIAETGSKVEVIESHYNYDESYVFNNAVTEIFADTNSHVDWHKLQNDSNTSYLLDSTYVKQERDSTATVNTFAFGGQLVRNNLDFIHNGENIRSFMNGVTVINEDQLIDHHTAVHHIFPNCESYQNYKGIYGGKSHGVFNGKVFVDRLAQKTNAYQQNNNILLSEESEIDSKPQLEIFADDVKCSHGCTVGQLDENALFYLRARGISKKEAQALLLYAFAHDAIQNIDIKELQLKVSKLLSLNLGVDLEF